MAQRVISAYGKIITAVGNFFLVDTSAGNLDPHVPCTIENGCYPAPVTADFANVQHVTVTFRKPVRITVDFERITA